MVDWALVPAYLMASASLLGWWATWRKSRREDDLSYFQEAKQLRQERQDWLTRENDYQTKLEVQEGRISSLGAEIEHLKRLLPMALVGSRFLNEEISADLAWLLEKSGCLWWVTSPVDRGSVVWATSAWERLLGCTYRDIHGTGWREFLHPAYRVMTNVTEARASRERIDGFPNTFISRDGREHELRWYAPSYRGVTLALALEVERETT